VRLEIEQETSDIASPDFGGLGPSWAKRTIKTDVVVRDQQSVVIGGLVSDRETQTETKVPILGDIPVLGYFFRDTATTTAKTNLLLVLTPYVVGNGMNLDRLLRRKVRERQELRRSFESLARRDYEPRVDYSRRCGLVEEINRTVKAVEREREVLRRLEESPQGIREGPIEEPAEGTP
jgi:general secretion pathway protein D